MKWKSARSVTDPTTGRLNTFGQNVNIYREVFGKKVPYPSKFILRMNYDFVTLGKEYESQGNLLAAGMREHYGADDVFKNNTDEAAFRAIPLRR